MTESLVATTTGRLFHVTVSGKLTEEAHCSLTAEAAEHIQRHDEIRLLLEVDETVGRLDGHFSIAFWEYAVFSFGHWQRVKRFALVGDPQWALCMAVLCKTCTPATILHFARADLEEAKRWVVGD